MYPSPFFCGGSPRFFVVPGCFRPQVAAVRAQPGKALHTKPHRTSPHPTSPRRAQPRHTRPSHTRPCLTTSSPPACRERMWCQVVFDRRSGGQRTAWQNAPHLASPSHAEPYLATPNLTRPCRAIPDRAMILRPNHAGRIWYRTVLGRYLDDLRTARRSARTTPCRALPNHT